MEKKMLASLVAKWCREHHQTITSIKIIEAE